MSKSGINDRQIMIRRFLAQLGNRTHHDGTADAKPASVSELDNILDSIDAELTPPLLMNASATPDLIVSVGAGVVANSETGRNRSMPHIGALLPAFAAGTVTFPAATAGAITVTPGNNGVLTVTANNYIKVLIYMDGTGNLNVLSGVENVVEASATVLAAPSGTLPIGYVTLFNNAGTIDNVIQSQIYQFGSGGGGGSGTGDANSFVETLKNRLNDSTYDLVTPMIAATDEDNLLDGATTAAYDSTSTNFKFSAIGQNLTSVQMADPTFLAEERSLSTIEVIAKWNSTAQDDAAVYEVSRNGGNEYQAVTMTRISGTDTRSTYG